MRRASSTLLGKNLKLLVSLEASCPPSPSRDAIVRGLLRDIEVSMISSQLPLPLDGGPPKEPPPPLMES